MRTSGRLVLAAGIAVTTAACSLVASLGDDYKSAMDASADGSAADVSVTGDARATDGGDGATPTDATTDSAETSPDTGLPPCGDSGLDPSFANGLVSALGNGKHVLFGFVLLGDGSLVAAAADGGSGIARVEIETFDRDGGFVAASGTPLAGIVEQWAARDGTLAGLLGGGPQTVFRSEIDGGVLASTIDGFNVEQLSVDDGHIVVGVVHSPPDSTYGVQSYQLDASPDLALPDAGTALRTLASGNVVKVMLANLQAGILEVAISDVNGAAEAVLVDGGVFATGPQPVSLGSLTMSALVLVPAMDRENAYLLLDDSSDASATVELLQPNGALSPSFNGGAAAVVPLPPSSRLERLQPTSGGKVWLVGITQGTDEKIPIVGRLLADGGLDPAWAGGGFAAYSLAYDGGPDPNVLFEGTQLTSDGRLVIGLSIMYAASSASSPAFLRYCP